MSDVYDYAAARLPSEWTNAIALFWEGFVRHADAIDRYYTEGDTAIDPAETTTALINSLPIELMWEYGPGVDGGHALALSSELNADALVFVRAVVSRAPELPRWTFSDARAPERSPDYVRQLVENRSFRDRLSILDVTFSEGRARTIDVAAHAVDAGVDAGLAAGQGELFLSVWLGETAERIWLGEFGAESVVYPRRKLLSLSKRPQGLDIEEAGRRLDLLVHELESKRPEDAWAAVDLENAQWSSFKGNPGEGDDPVWRADTIAGVSASPDVTMASLGGPRFRSERFSQHGETFCFLKIDGTEDSPIGGYEDRGELEQAINAVLQPAGLGAAFGGATGRRYSYIDLALTDLDQAIEALSSKLRDEALTRRAWLQFNDDGLEDFWVPVWPDAPAPPLPTRH